jgi:membrane-associated phospholipid phosphatase
MATKWALTLAVASVQISVYYAIGYSDRPRSTTLLALPLDGAIPFLPWTVWFYEPVYVAIFVIATLAFSSRRLYLRAIAGAIANMIVGAACHAFIPAAYPRQMVSPPYEDLTMAFMGFIHTIDPPGNVFPSLHVAHTTAIALVLRHDRRRIGDFTLLLALVLAASTLTTKQHFVLDVIAGFAMAAATSAAVLWPLRGAGAGASLTRTARTGVPG